MLEGLAVGSSDIVFLRVSCVGAGFDQYFLSLAGDCVRIAARQDYDEKSRERFYHEADRYWYGHVCTLCDCIFFQRVYHDNRAGGGQTDCAGSWLFFVYVDIDYRCCAGGDINR